MANVIKLPKAYQSAAVTQQKDPSPDTLATGPLLPATPAIAEFTEPNTSFLTVHCNLNLSHMVPFITRFFDDPFW